MQSKHSAWEMFAKDIQSCTLETLINNKSFLQTMFCGSYFNEEIKELEYFLSKETIKELTEELIENMTNANNVHQLYHLINFTNFIGKNNIKSIVEFGAGYGSFCVRCKKLLGNIDYNIVDLIELRQIQQDYLSLNNIDNCKWFNDIEQVEQGDTLVALWSLSETPIDIRGKFLKTNFKNYFFAFGDNFFELSNKEYFKKFQELKPDLNWHFREIPFIKNQYYLIGKTC